MNSQINNLNTNLLGAMYDLRTDSMAARQALIRESFLVSQYGQQFNQYSQAKQTDTNPTEPEVIEVEPCE
jgi:hypothetical protein